MRERERERTKIDMQRDINIEKQNANDSNGLRESPKMNAR